MGGTNVLWCACNKGLDAVALRLLDIGVVDIDAKHSTDGANVLWCACSHGLGAVALRLLDIGGVDIGAKHTNGTNVLWCACNKGLDAVALRLLDIGGVDVDAKSSTSGKCVLDHARAKSSLATVAARIVAIQRSGASIAPGVAAAGAAGGGGAAARTFELPHARASRLGRKCVFFSLRFGGPGDAQAEALPLRVALEARGFVVMPALDPLLVMDREKEIFTSIKKCDAFVVFANRHYGEDTGNPMCSFKECKFAIRKKKTFAVINMCVGDLDIDEAPIDAILNERIWKPYSVGADALVEWISAKAGGS
jgi:hypothetical protein